MAKTVKDLKAAYDSYDFVTPFKEVRPGTTCCRAGPVRDYSEQVTFCTHRRHCGKRSLRAATE